MATKYTGFDSVQTTGSPSTSTTSLSFDKAINSLQNSNQKSDEYYQTLLDKQNKQQQTTIDKSINATSVNKLSLEETTELNLWQDRKEFDKTLLESAERNINSPYSNNTLGDQFKNKLLGVGTSLVSDIGLNILKAPAEVLNMVNRASISSDSYAKATNIITKLNNKRDPTN